MSDLSKEPKSQSNDVSSSSGTEPSAIFSEPTEESSHRGLLIGMVVLAVVAIGAGLLIPRGADKGQDKGAAKAPNTILPADPAAKALVFSQLAMSQSTSLSGQTSTFLDGHIKNTGSGTLTAATIQVVFRNDVGLSPQVELLPLSVIRMHEPYIDTEPVSAAPIKPGDEAEFRLVFESIPENWNQQMPEVQVVHATLR